MLVSFNRLALCNSVRKQICRKFLVALYFRTIVGLFCGSHKIDNFPGKITFFINGSVNSKRAHSPPPPAPRGICHFVLEKLQMPHGKA